MSNKLLYIIFFILIGSVSFGQVPDGEQAVIEEVLLDYDYSYDNTLFIDSVLRNTPAPSHVVYEGKFNLEFKAYLLEAKLQFHPKLESFKGEIKSPFAKLKALLFIRITKWEN